MDTCQEQSRKKFCIRWVAELDDLLRQFPTIGFHDSRPQYFVLFPQRKASFVFFNIRFSLQTLLMLFLF